MSKYEDLFSAAARESRARGHDVPDWTATPNMDLGVQHEASLVELLLDWVGNPPPISRIAGQCALINASLLHRVASLFDVAPAYTIGSVIGNAGSTLFSCSWEEIDRWAQHDLATRLRSRAPFHVWLTLPHAQIVDFTFEASCAVAGELGQFGVIARPANAIKGFRYVPVAVGNDLPKRVLIPIQELPNLITRNFRRSLKIF